ncbi:MAG: prepilin-type N-terminal cleavage/methylation domain-containing protein [Deltaproteobacteria bacterium]|nr:prepilin-type N-terminal cleavage/methylation domain-containing protein [Deltaproteobacteria bacterium]
MFKSKKGFTLLEIMVALTILSIILMFVYDTFFATLRARDIVEGKNESVQGARIILQRLTRDLSAAVLVNYGEKQGSDEPIKTLFQGIRDEEDGYEMDKLHFTTLSHVPIPIDSEDNNQSALAEVSYVWERDSEEESIYLFRREDFAVDTELTEGGSYAMLGKGLQEFRLKYYTASSSGQSYQWVDEWDSTEDNTLPMAVEVRLVFKEQNNEEEGETESSEKVYTALIPLYLAQRK